MWKGNINYVVKLNVASLLAFMGFIPLKEVKPLDAIMPRHD